jgi:hypothetical protein
MPRYEAGALASGTLTGAGDCYGLLIAPPNFSLALLELGFQNTTTTACDVSLARVAYPQGASPSTTANGVEQAFGEATSRGVLATGYTTAQPAPGTYMRRAKCPNVVGGGTIWSWWQSPLLVTANTGIGLFTGVATGEIISMYFVWDE